MGVGRRAYRTLGPIVDKPFMVIHHQRVNHHRSSISNPTFCARSARYC